MAPGARRTQSAFQTESKKDGTQATASGRLIRRTQSGHLDGEREAEVAGGAAYQDGELAPRPDPGTLVLVPLREQPRGDPQHNLGLLARRRLGDPERGEHASRPAPVARRPGQVRLYHFPAGP